MVDDEAAALAELSRLLRTAFRIAPVDTAANSRDALRCLQERLYDIVFLDARMPDGIELASLLRRFALPPAIVFVTAHGEYAVRAFELGVCDYLLKPVSRARLGAAVDRALRRTVDRRDRSWAGDSSDMVPVQASGRTRLVFRDEVRWGEAAGDYVRLHTMDGDSHLVRVPISHLEKRWSAHGFIRIHRGYLVSLKYVTEFSVAGSIHTVTVGGRSLPVSRRHLRDVRDRVLRVGWRS